MSTLSGHVNSSFAKCIIFHTNDGNWTVRAKKSPENFTFHSWFGFLAFVAPLGNKKTKKKQNTWRGFSVCFSPGGRNNVQHGPPRLSAPGQGASGEHLWRADDLQPSPGGNPATLWQRGRPGLWTPAQRTGLLWRGTWVGGIDTVGWNCRVVERENNYKQRLACRPNGANI